MTIERAYIFLKCGREATLLTSACLHYFHPDDNIDNLKGSILKIGLSLFWRVLIVQIVFSLVFAILLVPLTMSRDFGLIGYKPTLVQGSFAIVLLLSMYLSKNGLVYLVWGKRLGLGTPFWRSFMKMLVVLMFLLAFSNVVAVHFLSMEQWLVFKTFAPLMVEIIFCLVVPPMLLAKLAQ